MKMIIDLGQQIQLSKLQSKAIDMVLDWHKSDRPFFVLAGYAGSGKSTLAKRIAEKLGGVFCAYTAKAANVLQQKGLPASTIHSLIYAIEGRDPDTDELLFKLKNDNVGGFLIVDEYSMIDKAVLDDLKRKYRKILFLGDPMQLPPVKDGKQALEPDFFLDEIHRQAADNPIIKWAHRIRQGEVPTQNINDNGQFIVKNIADLTDEEMTQADQIICGKNKTVRDINVYMRELYGFSDMSNIPVKGEKLICLQNNHNEGLANGYVFNAEYSAKDWRPWQENYSLQVGNKTHNVWDGDVLGKDKRAYDYTSRLERFDYAYAITCHKSQGSEFDSVIVINEAWGEQKLNWLYTAVTRCKQKCTLVNP